MTLGGCGPVPLTQRVCHHRRRLRGEARARAPNDEPQLLRNAFAFITFYHLFLSNILACPPNIFDKSTPVSVIPQNTISRCRKTRSRHCREMLNVYLFLIESYCTPCSNLSLSLFLF